MVSVDLVRPYQPFSPMLQLRKAIPFAQVAIEPIPTRIHRRSFNLSQLDIRSFDQQLLGNQNPILPPKRSRGELSSARVTHLSIEGIIPKVLAHDQGEHGSDQYIGAAQPPRQASKAREG